LIFNRTYWIRPLHVAAQCRRIDFAQVLLDRDANILTEDGDKDEKLLPVHYAVNWSNLTTVEFFLDKSFKSLKSSGTSTIDITSQYTDTLTRAIVIACGRGSEEIVGLLLRKGKKREIPCTWKLSSAPLNLVEKI
jgi:ankyrin repeat protein